MYGNENGVEESFEEISRITSSSSLTSSNNNKRQHGSSNNNKRQHGSSSTNNKKKDVYKSIMYFPPFVFRQANLDAFEKSVIFLDSSPPVHDSAIDNVRFFLNNN